MDELWLILGMFVVTFGTRYLLFLFAGQIRFSPWLRRALGFVPPVVLAAIVAPGVLLVDGQLKIGLDNPALIASLAAAAVALWRSQLVLTIGVGLLVFAALRLSA